MEDQYHHIWLITKPVPYLFGLVLLAAVIFSGSCLAGQSDADVASEVQNCYELLNQPRVDQALHVCQNAARDAQRFPISNIVRLDSVRALAHAELLNNQPGPAKTLLEDSIRSLPATAKQTASEAFLLMDLGNLLGGMHINDEAADKFQEAVDILERQQPVDNLALSGALGGLGMQKLAINGIVYGLPDLKRALNILPDSDSADVLVAKRLLLIEIADVYQNAGDLSKADEYRSQATGISLPRSGFNAVPSNYVTTGSSGTEAMKNGEFVIAVSDFKKQVAIAEERYGHSHPFTLAAEQSLALAHLASHNGKQAKPLVVDLLNSAYIIYENDFPFVSEADRLHVEQGAENRLVLFCNFVKNFYPTDDELVGRMYDLALWSKSSVLVTSETVRDRVLSSRDPSLGELERRLEAKRQQYLSAISSNSPDATNIQAAMLDLEREVITSLGLPTTPRTSWRDVQRRLKAGDAAVEVLRFADLSNGMITSSSSYVALIVRPEWPSPKLAYLGSAANIEGEQAAKYALYVTAVLASQKPAFEFWNNLEDALGNNVNRIYISPDGALNNISFAVIPSRKAGFPFLIDQYDIRVVTSTRDLTKTENSQDWQKTAVLVGNPDFDLSNRDYDALLTERLRTNRPPCTLGGQPSVVTGGSHPWKMLPETESEIRDTENTLCNKGWVAKSLTFDSALKEFALAEIDAGPGVLHFATHGFFRQDSTEIDSTFSNSRTDAAMLNSGLVLAGANASSRDEGSSGDSARSTLTAFEISSLNLRHTNLVVLSACDTGLGDTSLGREVFGLRRAFQLAGAKAVLMTMWAIPSEPTNTVIRYFYQNLLASRSVIDPQDALRAAQLQARRINNLPNFWGAFVLVTNH
jgi:CHAT domain-containing protein